MRTRIGRPAIAVLGLLFLSIDHVLADGKFTPDDAKALARDLYYYANADW